MSKRAALLGLAACVASLLLSLVLLRLVYFTELGPWLAEAIPAAAWERYEVWYGVADGEAGADRTALAFFVISLLSSMVIIGIGALVFALRRQAERARKVATSTVPLGTFANPLTTKAGKRVRAIKGGREP
ncbi:MAG: hypothetical protein JWN04_3855 [Myxococcaceae bacterium]|nr:hypothetical protein [Myxococcaceae bacterium]